MKRTRGAKPLFIYTNLYKAYTGENLPPVKERRLVYPIDLTAYASYLDTIVEKIGGSKAEAIREAVKHYAEYLRGLEVITYREVTKEQAKKEVQKYLKGKERVSADEISDALRINMTLVNEVLLELWQEGWVEPERRD